MKETINFAKFLLLCFIVLQPVVDLCKIHELVLGCLSNTRFDSYGGSESCSLHPVLQSCD